MKYFTVSELFFFLGLLPTLVCFISMLSAHKRDVNRQTERCCLYVMKLLSLHHESDRNVSISLGKAFFLKKIIDIF